MMIATRPAPATLVAAIGCVLIAANMRPAITSVGPLISDIRASTGMSAGLAGSLTTLPLIAFAVVSPLTPGLANRFGIGRVIQASLALLAAGLLLRSAGPTVAIFAGTIVIGSAIAIGNVLLPALVKRDFASTAGTMTGVYTATMSATAAVATAISVPLAAGLGLGWRGALAVWVGLAGLALVVGWPAARKAYRAPIAERPSLRLWRSALAWQVTLFMAMQSLFFYTLVTWMPTVLEEQGMSARDSGLVLAWMLLVSIGSTLVVPILAGRRSSQQGLVLAVAGLSLLGYLGFWLLGSTAAPVWAALLGLGSGSMFSLALTFFVLRAPDERHTTALSGMAQSLGYLIAAAGPSGVGFLHDLTGSWDLPLAIVLVASLCGVAFAFAAARDLQIGS
jgi:CP family cyanate transporter-like MFS transporter